MFTLPHIMAPKFMIQLPIRKCRTHMLFLRLTCNDGGYLKLGITISMHRNTTGSPIKLAVTSTNKRFLKNTCYWILQRGYVIRTFYVETNQEKHRWVAKTNTSNLSICRLDNSRFYYQKLLCGYGRSRDEIWTRNEIEIGSDNHEVTFAKNSP